jgi:hypothetical protein
MPELPENPNFDRLKKQAKDLLRQLQANEPEAFENCGSFCPRLRARTQRQDCFPEFEVARCAVLHRTSLWLARLEELAELRCITNSTWRISNGCRRQRCRQPAGLSLDLVIRRRRPVSHVKALVNTVYCRLRVRRQARGPTHSRRQSGYVQSSPAGS